MITVVCQPNMFMESECDSCGSKPRTIFRLGIDQQDPVFDAIAIFLCPDCRVEVHNKL